MEYKKFGSKYLIRLDRGEEIVKSIEVIVEKEKINLGKVSGIGAINKAEIGLFKSADKEYYSKAFEGDMEIVSLTGNISQLDGKSYLHLHIALGNESLNVIGGHLNSAIISLTGEVIIDVIDGGVDREFDEEIGLNLLKFN